MGRDERPGALEAFTLQADGEAAVPLLLDELVRTMIPDLHRAGSVLPCRDLALEGGVVEWVVFDVNRQCLLPWLERHALRHRPAGQRAASLEPEVVVQSAGVVALHDEDRLLRGGALLAERLGSLLRVALALVLGELFRHQQTFADTRRAARFNSGPIG